MHAKTRLVAVLFSSLTLVAGLSAADAPTQATGYFDNAPITGTPLGGDAKFTFVDGADPAVAPIAKAGFDEISRVGGLMVNQVGQALVSDDLGTMVSVMHLKNLALPKPVAGQPTVTAIKRTSLMIRDPHNKPDAADAAALEKIHQQLMDDQKPDAMIVQRIDRPSLPTEWRVYRPIAASKTCLACHGDPKTFKPEVKAALDKLYPEDKATDYSSQEWRGVIRVSLAEAKK
jgi:hypothetical protein